MTSIGDVLEQNKGIGKGFDFLRIFLAISVFFAHSFLIAEGEKHQFGEGLLKVFHSALLPMFFALSGFLITGSALRLNIKNFLLNRGIRIVPALAVDIFISALVIGPIFTTLPLKEYFSAYEFRAYFANLVGLIHYVLPCVFQNNPFPETVNGSLWTVPFEILCYIIMSFLIISGAIKKKYVTLIISALAFAIIAFFYANPFSLIDWLPLPANNTEKIKTAVHHYFSARGNFLYVFFLVGSLTYLFRYSIPYQPVLLAGSLLVICVVGHENVDIDHHLKLMFLAPLFVYVTVCIGLIKIPALPLFKRGDYSYGIYLYEYPIQQAIIAIFPFLSSPWMHFAVTLPITVIVAMLSWHFVEKPVLAIRKNFSFTARKGDEAATIPN